ncbi:hypothetical protein [Pontibacter sp. G13]|uniref:hypothetical protein n=1 Tax=Pontibacter sp. G13 TaxID=3074898 RepID=UPI00288A468E|nr:hypothetical protein [Pontibacter sp. G13]WNJ19661.1 hypothetical protein RJD25_04175 [Pontibacter sp. G13]
MRFRLILFGGILLFTLYAHSLHAQNQLQLHGGFTMGAGWWVYDRGQVDGSTEHIGYDRTHLSGAPGIKLQIGHASPKWVWSLSGSVSSLMDDEMIGSDNQRGSRSRYYVTEFRGNVGIREVTLGLGYQIWNQPKLRLVPTLQLGTFWMKHTHPEKSDMQLPISFAGEFHLLINLSDQLEWDVYPSYSRKVVLTGPEAPTGSRHHIYLVGIGTGLTFSFGKSKMTYRMLPTGSSDQLSHSSRYGK